MEIKLGVKARRMAIAAGLAITMGLPTLACMGGGDVEVTPTPTPAPEPAGGEVAPEPSKSSGIEQAMLGTYRVIPSDQMLRELKIINAAVEGRPPKKFEPLSAGEKQLYQDVKSGKDKEFFRNLIAMIKGSRVTFEAGGAGRYDFDGGKNPFKWTASNISEKSLDIVLTYDHGTVEKAKFTLKGGDILAEFSEPMKNTFTLKK